MDIGKLSDVSTSVQYRTACAHSVRRVPPDGASYPRFASRLRKNDQMASALLTPDTGMPPNFVLGRDIGRAIAHFERELATHRQEEARLRSALAKAEALLLERTSVPDPVETAGPHSRQEQFANCGVNLTPRQYEIMNLVLDGHPSKNIAADLGISRRTVENHRAEIMKKTGSKSLPALGGFGFVASRSMMSIRTGNAFAAAGAASHS